MDGNSRCDRLLVLGYESHIYEYSTIWKTKFSNRCAKSVRNAVGTIHKDSSEWNHWHRSGVNQNDRKLSRSAPQHSTNAVGSRKPEWNYWAPYKRVSICVDNGENPLHIIRLQEIRYRYRRYFCRPYIRRTTAAVHCVPRRRSDVVPSQGQEITNVEKYIQSASTRVVALHYINDLLEYIRTLFADAIRCQRSSSVELP